MSGLQSGYAVGIKVWYAKFVETQMCFETDIGESLWVDRGLMHARSFWHTWESFGLSDKGIGWAFSQGVQGARWNDATRAR